LSKSDRAKILVVDDDRKMRDYLRDLLERSGYRVEMAEDGQRALGKIAAIKPDLVLLDVHMPGMNGLEVLRIIKVPRDMYFLPVILLTADRDLESRLSGLRLGADDYLTKPINNHEVLARTEALLRIKHLQDQIAASRKDLEDASLTDPITGLYNDRYLDIRLGDEFKRAERYNEPLSYTQLQIENFTALKKERRQAGMDDLMRDFSAVVRAGVREFDVVIRKNDDNFVVILPRTHFSGAMAVASRLWSSVRTGRDHWKGLARELTVSIGAAFFPDRDVTCAKQLAKKAEQALQHARSNGNDQICMFQQTAYLFRPDQSR
jgi:diguanylate cyclase (GGDEF)-like protein